MIPFTVLGLAAMACIGHDPPRADIQGTPALTVEVQCNVPATAPDLTPAWFADPARHVRYGNSRIMVLKDVVRVDFRAGVTQEERQAALDVVGGCVVGGGLGLYYVRVPTEGTLASLESRVATLQTLPQISHATIYIVSGAVEISN